jgi:hypothetical protein
MAPHHLQQQLAAVGGADDLGAPFDPDQHAELPDDLGGEAVIGADLDLLSSFDMGGEVESDAVGQLACSLVGEGDAEHLLRGDSAFGHHRCHPQGDGRGLAGSRPRRHPQRAHGSVDHRLLLRGRFEGHGR